MFTIYLFQIDGAENNGAFFAALRKTLDPASPLFYKGIALRIGDWIPDGVRVDVEESRCSLTLIELEDTKAEARKSCRKYLPESSRLIIRAFEEYLERIIGACRSTGDPRESNLSRLKEMIGIGARIVVRTACALRSGTEMLEEWSLIDQPETVESQFTSPDGSTAKAKEEMLRPLQGVLRLNAEKVNALGRCILILDSIIRHQDHSGATFHSWRNKSPLKRSLKDATQRPILKSLLLGARAGMTLDCEGLFAELASRWENLDARSLVTAYYPRASEIRSHDVMNVIFEEARECLKRTGVPISVEAVVDRDRWAVPSLRTLP